MGTPISFGGLGGFGSAAMSGMAPQFVQASGALVSQPGFWQTFGQNVLDPNLWGQIIKYTQGSKAPGSPPPVAPPMPAPQYASYLPPPGAVDWGATPGTTAAGNQQWLWIALGVAALFVLGQKRKR